MITGSVDENDVPATAHDAVYSPIPMTPTAPRTFARYVALGDSSTEGLDDPDGRGGYRGWANRLAAHVAAVQPGGLLYANLGVRGRKLVRASVLALALGRDDVALREHRDGRVDRRCIVHRNNIDAYRCWNAGHALNPALSRSSTGIMGAFRHRTSSPGVSIAESSTGERSGRRALGGVGTRRRREEGAESQGGRQQSPTDRPPLRPPRGWGRHSPVTAPLPRPP